MTERAHSLTVILSNDMRVDDVEHLVHAIQMMKFVHSVEPNTRDSELAVVEHRLKREVIERLYDVIQEFRDKTWR